MMSLTFGLFTQVSDSGPLGPLVDFSNVCCSLSCWLSLGNRCVQEKDCYSEPQLLVYG